MLLGRPAGCALRCWMDDITCPLAVLVARMGAQKVNGVRVSKRRGGGQGGWAGHDLAARPDDDDLPNERGDDPSSPGSTWWWWVVAACRRAFGGQRKIRLRRLGFKCELLRGYISRSFSQQKSKLLQKLVVTVPAEQRRRCNAGRHLHFRPLELVTGPALGGDQPRGPSLPSARSAGHGIATTGATGRLFRPLCLYWYVFSSRLIFCKMYGLQKDD